MYHKRFTADRWLLSAHSIYPLKDAKSATDVALLHPGWASNPKHTTGILESLAKEGLFPIALDTRYGYANRQPLRPAEHGRMVLSTLRRPRGVGDSNRYFPDATRSANRSHLRRPTATLALADALGLEQFHLIGHSDGGRTVATVASRYPARAKSLTLVNAVGTDPALTPGMSMRELSADIRDRKAARIARNAPPYERTPKSGLDRLYHLAHPVRGVREALVIGRANTWPEIGDLANAGVPVNVVHGIYDPTLDVDRVQQRAADYPAVNFVPVEGGHNAIYDPAVAQTIARLVGNTIRR